MTAPPNSDEVSHGRVFTRSRVVRLGDAGPDATMQLDAVGRYLQDIASDDMADAGMPGTIWLVRRTALRITQRPRLGDTVAVTTRCTGLGSRWAERVTTIEGATGHIASTALWVHVDADTGRPEPIPDSALRVYETAANGRRITSKLTLPAAPEPDCSREPWTVRVTDLDVVGHVNNAVYLSIIEGAPIDRGTIELEYRMPLDLDSAATLLTSRDGRRRWLVSDNGIHAVAVATPE